MTVEYRVVSIGALSRNRLWGEGAVVRTAHATTTLVREGERTILVDPSLPSTVLQARLHERSGLRLADVTDVFCTTLRPVHRRAIEGLDGAAWWAAERELEAYRHHLEELLESAGRLRSEDAASVREDILLVERFRPAPDGFGPQISLFPLPGTSPGSCGLLLTPATKTVLVAGDAVLTGEHLAAGQVWQGAWDAEAATESLREAMEIADIIVPGHDNVVLSPGRMM